MPYCPKCGAEVSEGMNFCSKCGATLGPLPPRVRREKEEKHEKREKSEKAEKHEKREYSYIGPLIGGLILIAVGLMAYIATISPTYARNWGPCPFDSGWNNYPCHCDLRGDDCCREKS